ncbi:MAG: hypothetical protein JKX88_06765 [Marinicaulis sp.]|nr:hypothetical protein [Marinicaulis sp.]
MKKLVLFSLVLLGCESISQTDRDAYNANPVKSKLNEVEIQDLDCYNTDYFGNESFAYKIDPTESDSRRFKTDKNARELFSATFCEAGLSSMYERRNNNRAEVYRLLYHPSPSSPIIVEFDFANKNSFFARSWEDDWLLKENPNGTTRVVSSRYEKWEPIFGPLSDDQANNIRSIFDSKIVCEPVDPRGRKGDATARIFEYLSDGRYCALIDFTRKTGNRSKAILSIVGLSDLYEGE